MIKTGPHLKQARHVLAVDEGVLQTKKMMVVARKNSHRIGKRTHSFIQHLFQMPSTGDPEATWCTQ